VDDSVLQRLRDDGLSDEAIVQAVAVAAMFSHLTRVADATGLELDYDSPLPRFEVDASREHLPRPDPSAWPAVGPARLPLALLPPFPGALAALQERVFTPTEALSARDRAVIVRAAAFQLCDAAGVAAHDGAAPRSPREAALAAYAEKLTLTPWRMTEADLAPLRREGLDDRALLHVIALVGFQNVASRLQLALGSWTGSLKQ
jgi:alkylhydroperoxidase family enzyme